MSAVLENSHYKKKYWICAFLLFVLSFPKWVWGYGYNIMIVASLVLLVFAFKDIRTNGKITIMSFIGLLFQIAFLITYLTNSRSNIAGYISVIISGVGFATIFFCSNDFLKKCTDCFIVLLALLLIPAIIEHIAVSYLGFETGSVFTQECPINTGRKYYIFKFNVYIVELFSLYKRFFAFYDEPGVLGNITMVMLYIQRFNLKKWYNVVFLISGILSFSLAFYIAVAVYFILFGNFKSKLFFLIAVIVGVYYFYNNEMIFDLVFGRMEINDGHLSGYNRDNSDFKFWINRTPVSSYLLWGYQPRDAVPYAASWRWAFAQYGVLPSLLYLFFLIFPRAKRLHNRKDIFIGLALITVIWIQRPFIHLFLYAYLLIIPFAYYNSDVNECLKINGNHDNED
jgi:hypothetical protein